MRSFEPIAIVGEACLLPGAHSSAELWRAVMDGRDLLSNATAETWQVADQRRLMRADANAAPGERIPTTRGGYVRGFENVIRPSEYGLDAELVRRLDPLFQWLLHVGHEAVHSAGIPATSLARGGAIIGNLSYPTYALNEYAWSIWAEAAGLPARKRPDARNRFMSGLPVVLLARSLGLQRGGFMLDAACASSLYAIRYACDWLQTRRADFMLSGGVARVHGLTIHAGFTTLQALSPTGQSRPLHAEADGLVPSEGAAIVVLKRLSDAQRDGNRILGVIRAIGLSNDGRGSGLLVPSADGQVRAMEAAYAMSGLSPRDIDLIECHATGTSIGDATEIASCARVFGTEHSAALGSLKSNLGHLLPVAGVAGLIKVLKSIEHGVHGSIRGLDAINTALDPTAFRPIRENQEWKTREVRRAAVNAFGFGGNNAHLVVEEVKAPTAVRLGRGGSTPASAPRIAVVALALRAGNVDTASDYARLGAAAPQSRSRSIDRIALPIVGSAFPPADLAQALPQQLLALELAATAMRDVSRLRPDSTSVFVGMGCDSEACRFGLLLRVSEFLQERGVDAAVGDQAAESVRQRIRHEIVAAKTLGLMPNILTNRINRQFGLRGPSCSVSAEENSGLHALELAIAALGDGTCDAALVGVVELGADPVHAAARRETGFAGDSADGGCMLVLKREDDALRDGDRILALVAPLVSADASDLPSYERSHEVDAIEARAGVAHAARGLMRVAGAIAAVENGATESAEAGLARQWFRIARSTQSLAQIRPAPETNKVLTFPAHLPPVADFLRDLIDPAEPMPPAPRRSPLRPDALAIAGEPYAAAAEETDLGADHPPRLEPMAAAEELPADAEIGGSDVVRLHELFLEEMGAAHAAFLRSATGRAATPLAAAEGGNRMEAGNGVPALPSLPVEVGADLRAALSSREQSETVSPSHPSSQGLPEVGPYLSNSISPALPGPKFSREDLIELASGDISKHFGPDFAGQDGFTRQVRMPMPPMLLADRVTGIDATPGVLGTGKIWTETDVGADAWYLDGDRMPLGITIEAGQADLLLVSWMGIDRFNRSERIYRLLGCEATIKGPLPKIGDTLKFEIAIDGHAELGPIRMMFFHSDLFVNGEVRLSVRHGQAGFFTDEELANSEGVLWDAETAPAPALRGTHSKPRIGTPARSFGREEIRAFAEGRPADCFGAPWRRTRAHTRSPRIGSGRMQLFDEVTHFDPNGGPWKRGYLRTVMTVTPDLWFFSGHFKNDPCMPGTLMLEGAVQSMAFYLAALGCTLHADGWRFEPPADQTVVMRCRGQCVPTSRELVYELYIEEFNDGPVPRLRASVMGSVDGLKAFFAEGLTLELVPDWPLDAMLRRSELVLDAARPVWTLDGFPFDHRSLLACALGRPSEAFGPGFKHLDGPIRIPRLPRPPYHFMSRITACTARMGQPERGVVAECDFDFRATDWFFGENGAPTMPSCVFMEALLQPCGWLSSFVRDSSGQTEDLFFRNLDGTLTWHSALPPADGTLHVRTELTNWSELGTMIIVSFRVDASIAGASIATMETAFGFFPGDAFANQAGISPTALETEYFRAPATGNQTVSNTSLACGALLAAGRLLMLDRITGWWPEAGEAKLGIVRAEKDVKPGEWFFNAHFMQDPVQPGSLGIEALVQLLQCAIRLRGLGRDLLVPEFEPVGLGEPLVWKYRGQVVPEDGVITTLVELVEIVAEPAGSVLVRARGSLWIDGKKIYETPKLAMRVREAQVAVPAIGGGRTDRHVQLSEYSLVQQPWLNDHRPSFTRSVIPLTALIDEAARAVASAAVGSRDDAPNLSFEAFFPARWALCPEDGTTQLRSEVRALGDDAWAVQLSIWRNSRVSALSRFDLLTETVVRTGSLAAPAPLAPLDAPEVANPYVTHETTHGPAFQLVREVRRSAAGASCVIDASAGSVPINLLHPALLDACTHVVPLSRLAEWYPAVADRYNGLPRGVSWLKVYGGAPRGLVRCEIRPKPLDPVMRLPVAYVQFIVGDSVWCDLEMEFALLDAAPFHQATFAQREAFIRRAIYQPAIRFSADEHGAAVLRIDDLARYQWMPQQLESMFGLPPSENLGELAEAIAARELVAHAAEIHPAHVAVTDAIATAAPLPVQQLPLEVMRTGDEVRVQAGFWQLAKPAGATFFSGPFLSDLMQAVTQRFVRFFRLESPEEAAALRGQPAILCSNHQTALESLLFTDLYMRWSGLPLTTVTRVEHQRSWVGQVTELLWRFPTRTISVHPQMLFDRDRPDSFFDLIRRFKEAQAERPHVLHLHVEGEQARQAGQPVARMTSAIIDLALETGLPIVPVKFSGGLPREPLDEIVSFPFAYGRQDYTVGSPIWPDTLRRVPRPKAAEQVVGAINALPPATDAEMTLENDAGFVAAIEQLRRAHGLTEVQACVLAALRELPNPSAVTRAILDPRFQNQADGRGALPVSPDEQAWHREFATWLWRRDANWQQELEAWKLTAKT